jgi:hypothetical protein
LFVELDAASHASEALQTLRNPWLASVLAIEAVIGVFGDGGHPSSAAVQAGLASCDVVCVRGDPAAFAPLAAGKRVLDASRATLAALQGVSVSDPRKRQVDVFGAILPADEHDLIEPAVGRDHARGDQHRVPATTPSSVNSRPFAAVPRPRPRSVTSVPSMFHSSASRAMGNRHSIAGR